MPELPDVEKFRRLVAERAAGARVRGARVPDPELLAGTTPQGLGRSLADRRLAEPYRHGKWLFLPFGGPTLVVHFRMSGELVWTEPEAVDDHDAVVLALDSGELRYRSRRRLGRVCYVPEDGDTRTVTGELGPDALEVDAGDLARILAGHRSTLKSALMNQELIAGLGNELVDDILWRARLHPRTAARDLDDGTVEGLHHELSEVLRRAVATGHVPSGPGWLNGQRRLERPVCPSCGAALRREPVAGRTTLWCPVEQPAAGAGVAS